MEDAMKPITCTLLICVLLVIIGMACTDSSVVDRVAEIQKITAAVDACIGWAKDKDLDLLYSTVANDDEYLSVHPTSRVVRGFEMFKEAVPFWMNPDFQYVRHEITDLTIHLSKSGDAAWFYCMLNDMNTWKGEPANWENTRWTGVLEKRNSHWIIVQQHFSFAAER